MRRRLSFVFAVLIPLIAWSPGQSGDRQSINQDDPGYAPPDPSSIVSPPSVLSFRPGLAPAQADTCVCLDLVLVIDDTGSMGGAINNVKAEIVNILGLADSICGDVQAGLVTFKDDVEVDVPMTANLASVAAAVNALVATGGAQLPEASDEALREVVDLGGTSCTLTGDFDPGDFREDCCKVVILVTDAEPGGCDDTYTAGVDDVNAHNVALLAAASGIHFGAVFVPTGGDPNGTIVPVMADYAATTGGVFGQTAADGSGTAAAIQQILLDCIGTIRTELCCIDGTCVEVLEGSCEASGGYLVTNCDVCGVVGTKSTTWGGIKTLYKND
jgi:uncharacterized protein YegL